MNYSTSGASLLSFFSVQRGASTPLITNGSLASRTKTYRDTNLEQAGVSSSKRWDILGISVGFIHLTENTKTNAADRNKLMGASWINFKIIDSTILVVPAICIPELNPVMAASTTANDTSVIAQATGAGLLMYKLGTPVTIQASQGFTFEWNVDGGTATTLSNAVDIFVALQGYVTRPSS